MTPDQRFARIRVPRDLVPAVRGFVAALTGALPTRCRTTHHAACDCREREHARCELLLAVYQQALEDVRRHQEIIISHPSFLARSTTWQIVNRALRDGPTQVAATLGEVQATEGP